jgi:hypothetical protein
VEFFFGNGGLTVTKLLDYVRYMTPEAGLANFAQERDLDRAGTAWGALRVPVSSKRVEPRRLRMCNRRSSRRRVGTERRSSSGASGRQAAPADQRADAEAGTPETPTDLDRADNPARSRSAGRSGRSTTAPGSWRRQ